MPSVDGEVTLTLARLLDFHYPWKTDDLHSPDYREVNSYLIQMVLSFQDKHTHTDWAQIDMLDELDNYLLEYCNTHPFTWTTIEV
jgi:hypothetical protein